MNLPIASSRVDRTNGAISAGMRRQIATAERKECVPLVPTHNVQSAPLKTRQTQSQEFGSVVQFMGNFVVAISAGTFRFSRCAL